MENNVYTVFVDKQKRKKKKKKRAVREKRENARGDSSNILRPVV